MTRQEIIENLSSLQEPNREVDRAIAVFFNYRREKVVVPAKGSKTPRIKVKWYDPSGYEFRVLPHFTEHIDAAKSLFEFVMLDTPGAFSFHDGFAKATVAGGETVTAFNIATAICLATIKAMR